MMNIDHNMKIKVNKDGCYTVIGGIPLSEQMMIPDDQGLSINWKEGKRYQVTDEYELCRCGQSQNKPFCDGTHKKISFNGTETANRTPFMDQVEPKTSGAVLDLFDVLALCADARFCDRIGGAWDNTRDSDKPEAKKIAIQEVFNCPAGRLVLKDKNGIDLEPTFEPSIGLVMDMVFNVSGPIWVRGGIPVEAADGSIYEIRNRMTLCRCGKSKNKPFCDGKHENIDE
jgi:CDGSH-type Zn-finger protein